MRTAWIRSRFSSNGQTIEGNGSGQTIAIVVADHNAFLWDELYLFDAYYGLPNPNFTQINLAGNQTNDGWATEEALDVEWAHAMAPGASIDVVEARSDSLADLMNAVNLARRLAGRLGRVHELGQRRVRLGNGLRLGLHHARRTQRSHLRGRQRRFRGLLRRPVAGFIAQRRGRRWNHAVRERRGLDRLPVGLVGQRRRL